MNSAASCSMRPARPASARPIRSGRRKPSLNKTVMGASYLSPDSARRFHAPRYPDVERHRIVFQSAAQETDMGKGEQRSNREKKKPKAEKNKVKAGPAPSPFAMAKSNDKPGKK